MNNYRNTIQKAARTVFVALSLGFIFLIGAAAAQAQDGYRVSKRISFKKGEISSSIKGSISSRLEGHKYFFRVRKGQTVLIKLISSRKDLTFYLMDEEGNSMAEEVELREWTGELPETGDYHLVIGSKHKGVAKYTLFIQIASDI
jgi:hypothetical protein